MRSTGKTIVIDGVERELFDTTVNETQRLIAESLAPYLRAIRDVSGQGAGIVFVRHDVVFKDKRIRRGLKRFFGRYSVIGMKCSDAVRAMGEQDFWTQEWLSTPPNPGQIKVWLFVGLGTLLLTLEDTPDGMVVVSRLSDEPPASAAWA